MRYFILVVLLTSCYHENVEPKYCIKMVRISDANPVQFWINNIPTFNEKPEAGVDHACFYQPWNCEDTLQTQVIADEESIIKMSVRDEQDEEIESLDLLPYVSRPTVYHNEYLLDAVCNQKIKLRLTATEFEDIFTNSGFTGGGTGWSQGATGIDWSFVGNKARVNLTGGTNSSKALGQAYAGSPGQYRLKINATLSEDLPSQTSVVQQVQLNFNTGGINGTTVHTYNFGELRSLNVGNIYTIDINTVQTIPLAFDFISLSVGQSGGGNPACRVEVDFVIAQSPSITIFNSDYLDIRDNHADTRLISVTNGIDYAGLAYEDITPEPQFSLRLKSKFYVPRFPEENESEPDGGGNVDKLSSEVKTQRLLEVDPLPPYMLYKVKLHLQHNTIYVENQAWIKEEPLDQEQVGDQNPFFKSNTYLTLKNDEYFINLP
jgi:hypothetical protein